MTTNIPMSDLLVKYYSIYLKTMMQIRETREEKKSVEYNKQILSFIWNSVIWKIKFHLGRR